MNHLCSCEDWKDVTKDHTVFIKDSKYGWVLHWVELTEESGYTQVHRYGRPIKFCPMCGKSLETV